MTTKYKIDWFRFTVEVSAIVLGILLAFALKALYEFERQFGAAGWSRSSSKGVESGQYI